LIVFIALRAPVIPPEQVLAWDWLSAGGMQIVMAQNCAWKAGLVVGAASLSPWRE